jgi:hypothetical protein
MKSASLLAACSIARLCLAWTPAQTAQQPRPCRLRAAQVDADAYPPAPWSFSNARVMYQPTLVRTSAARAVTPRDGLRLLSFFGWTLGGVFVVDWADSPVGPYREVAVLSGLVARGFAIGAWASHIVVTTPASVGGGRAVFGLPTVLGDVKFNAAEESDGDAWRRELTGARDLLEDIAVAFKVGIGAAQPGIAEPAERLRRRDECAPPTRGFDFVSDRDVTVTGWDGWSDGGPAEGPSLSLPSFSGRLAEFPELLRYPLKLGPAGRVALRPSMPTRWSGVSDDLAAVLDGPRACPSIQVDGVAVVAGRPEVD